jgi:plasmid stabilization system protein ParE
MTNKEVKFLREAEADVLEAMAWYLERSISAGINFKSEVDIAAVRISQFPRLFPVYMFRTRKCLLCSYPYALIFKEFDTHIQVFAVASMIRKPGYWKNRLKR